MIELVRVSKRRCGRGEDMVLNNVSMRVDAGEVVAISGAVGAGKSTLLSMIYGAVLADSGRVSVFDHDVGRLRRTSIALLRRRIGIISQTPRFLERRTALDNVRLVLEVCGLSRRECRTRAAHALGSVGLGTCVDVRVSELSAGERQRVAFARAIVADPRLIIADEPTANLDTESSRELIELLGILQAAGATALIATGDQEILAKGALSGWRQVELVDGHLHDDSADVDIAGLIDVEDTYDQIDIAIVEPEPEPEPAPNVVPFPVAAH